MRKLYILAALAGSSFLVAPAGAALTLVTNCNAAPADVLGGYAQTCAGYYQGNLVNNASSADQIAALQTLGFNTAGFNFNSFTKIENLNGSTTINFGTPLSGVTYFAVHYGGGQPGPTPGNNVTAFYRVDFGAATVNSIQLQFGATSNAILYSTAPIPEPATWAMMIGGFGLIGGFARRRRQSRAIA
jgi:hypothetical protein